MRRRVPVVILAWIVLVTLPDLVAAVETNNPGTPSILNEVEKNTQIREDDLFGDYLISKSPTFNGASTGIGSVTPEFAPEYPISEHDIFSIKPNSSLPVNKELKPYLEIGLSNLIQARSNLDSSGKALLKAFINRQEKRDEFARKKLEYDKFVFQYYVEGGYSLFNYGDTFLLRDLSTLDYLIQNKKNALTSSTVNLKTAQNNLLAVELSYSGTKINYQNKLDWVNFILSVNDDIGESKVNLTTLRYIMNLTAAKYYPTSSKCACKPAVNFSSESYSDIKKIEAFANKLGFKAEILKSLSVSINGVDTELISTPTQPLMNNQPAVGQVSPSPLLMFNNNFKQPTLVLKKTLSQANYPKNFSSELLAVNLSAEVKDVSKKPTQKEEPKVTDKKYQQLVFSAERSNYGPGSALININDFKTIKKSLGGKANYKIVLYAQNLEELESQYLWRVRNFAGDVGLVEENVSWAPGYWEFLNPLQATQIVNPISYQLTTGRNVNMERPASIKSYKTPILENLTCSKFMEEPLVTSFLLIKYFGLSNLIDKKDFGGCYAPRIIEGYSTLSYHARGLAIDLNVQDNLMTSEGLIDTKIVSILDKYGLRWGGYWNRKDPMHFELASILKSNS